MYDVIRNEISDGEFDAVEHVTLVQIYKIVKELDLLNEARKKKPDPTICKWFGATKANMMISTDLHDLKCGSR